MSTASNSDKQRDFSKYSKILEDIFGNKKNTSTTHNRGKLIDKPMDQIDVSSLKILNTTTDKSISNNQIEIFTSNISNKFITTEKAPVTSKLVKIAYQKSTNNITPTSINNTSYADKAISILSKATTISPQNATQITNNVYIPVSSSQNMSLGLKLCNASSVEDKVNQTCDYNQSIPFIITCSVGLGLIFIILLTWMITIMSLRKKHRNEIINLTKKLNKKQKLINNLPELSVWGSDSNNSTTMLPNGVKSFDSTIYDSDCYLHNDLTTAHSILEEVPLEVPFDGSKNSKTYIYQDPTSMTSFGQTYNPTRQLCTNTEFTRPYFKQSIQDNNLFVSQVHKNLLRDISK